MKELIEALQIFNRYQRAATHCEHDVLSVCYVSREEVSEVDRKRLEELGFFWSAEIDAWSSFRWGSA